jgi:leader peptidase (prepilin peptidase) / N-methyltransferase
MIELPPWFGGLVAAIFGAIIGSFLNAVIHRLPRGISLDKPRRSFCPSCQSQIAWYHNLPIISWLWLRGRCASCGANISIRYWIIELLTAGLFFALWELHGWPLAPIYAIFTALLIAATFIDIDFLIIPDEITIGGTLLGVLLAMLVPSLVGATTFWQGGLYSLFGAALGFGLLWLVVEAGKLAFGKKKRNFPGPTPFTWTRQNDTAEFDFNGERLPWEEIFSRESDELILECDPLIPPGGSTPVTRLTFRYDRLRWSGGEANLDHLDSLSGVVHRVIIPREAMGFGDVKFIAAIGAFLGWKAVLFTIFASSIVGCFFGLGILALSRGKAAPLIPFGPFLALGALLWMLGGSALWDWYLGILRPQ